jgi:hypothetical protein
VLSYAIFNSCLCVCVQQQLELSYMSGVRLDDVELRALLMDKVRNGLRVLVRTNDKCLRFCHRRCLVVKGSRRIGGRSAIAERYRQLVTSANSVIIIIIIIVVVVVVVVVDVDDRSERVATVEHSSQPRTAEQLCFKFVVRQRLCTFFLK